MIQLNLTKEDAVILAAGLDALTRVFGSQLANTGAINEVLPKLSAIEGVLGKLNSVVASALACPTANGAHRGEPASASISN